jgi:hypothetical protein
MQTPGNRRPGLLVFLCLGLALSGCGGEDAFQEADVPHGPEVPPSCETLEPRVEEDPLTGGAFQCLWCSREWSWSIPAAAERLFVLIALRCESLHSEAYLEIEDTDGTVLWLGEVEEGDARTYCICHEDPRSGTLSVRLRGGRRIPFAVDLIEEFRGSVYLKIFNEEGERLAGPNLRVPSGTHPWP